jgi:diguanylate cyclase (GGDEF)-like protein
MADRLNEQPAAPTVTEPPEGTTRQQPIAVLVRALQSLFESSAAAFVPTAARVSDLGMTEAAGPEISAASLAVIKRNVLAWLARRGGAVGVECLTVDDEEWCLVLAESRTQAGERLGAIVLGRPLSVDGSFSANEIRCVQMFAGLCGSAGDGEGGQSPASSRSNLDALVTRVAVELMAVSADTLPAAQEWTLHELSQFFDVDISFLRRNDFERQSSVLVAEWPRREVIPDPDPLGEVPFDADPMFAATRDFKEPIVMRPDTLTDDYQERVREGSGVDEVSVAVVPLIRNGTTIGMIGFVKFGDRAWETAETNALQAVASLMVQVQARIDAEERHRYQAYHDELTGLPNRRALMEELHRRLGRGPGRQTALLFLDLDRFKALNDFLGHRAGDRLLVTVAQRLRHAMGPGDFVSRLAGDEFVFLLEGPEVELEALGVADRLLEQVAEAIEIDGHHVSRTASLGISFSHGLPMAGEDLLADADAALHKSKDRGGGQAVVFDTELRTSVEQRADTELLLREAIDHVGLMLYYQPEIDLNTGRLLAVEALVRWVHPQRGVLAAGSFIGVAEETGLIADLGKWVLAEACRQMALWRERYPMLRLVMRVNISPAQLATRNIVDLVKECLEENHLPGRLLCLEITEHAVVSDVDRTVQVLHDLKALGVTLAIDDFGTGYSSMTQLKRLPVDVLKIDQTFVSGLGIDDGDRAIVDVTVRLAKSFGLEVVAEGVETVELVHELLELGCHRAQGFLLCRPKPASDLELILVKGGISPSSFQQKVPVLMAGSTVAAG